MEIGVCPTDRNAFNCSEIRNAGKPFFFLSPRIPPLLIALFPPKSLASPSHPPINHHSLCAPSRTRYQRLPLSSCLARVSAVSRPRTSSPAICLNLKIAGKKRKKKIMVRNVAGCSGDKEPVVVAGCRVVGVGNPPPLLLLSLPGLQSIDRGGTVRLTTPRQHHGDG